MPGARSDACFRLSSSLRERERETERARSLERQPPDKNSPSRVAVVTTAGLIEPSGGSLAQQLRVVRLLSNGIESAERKMKSSESRERKCQPNAFSVNRTNSLEGREGGRSFYIVLNYIKVAQLKSQFVPPLKRVIVNACGRNTIFIFHKLCGKCELVPRRTYSKRVSLP